MRLADKIAVVIGAGRGLGRACALRYAQEGADLLLLDVASKVPGAPYPLASPTRLAETARQCAEFGNEVVTSAVDMADASAIDRAIGLALDRFGGVDVVLDNAGVVTPAGRPVHEIRDEEWQDLVEVDLGGARRLIRAVAPVMVKRRGGSIVIVSCTAGLVGYRNFDAYVAAKHGLIGLTRAAALDYAPYGVRVNALCPGTLHDDPGTGESPYTSVAGRYDEPETTSLPARRTNVPTEPDVAGAALWLAGDDARQITGSLLAVDGGYRVR
ncbi:SDR family oxidoreductase [Embleya sp. AB8]|uniref:SDR family oxidoreductase n=1 Tax=Embleya sp. AB8 TaxID=3156304 RepID=UPI003C7338D0